MMGSITKTPKGEVVVEFASVMELANREVLVVVPPGKPEGSIALRTYFGQHLSHVAWTLLREKMPNVQVEDMEVKIEGGPIRVIYQLKSDVGRKTQRQTRPAQPGTL
jgi:hypothetical protein